MTREIVLLTVLLLISGVGSTCVFAAVAEMQDQAAEATGQEEPSDSLEPAHEETGRKRFWLTDPAMIEKGFRPSAYKRTFPLMKDLTGDKALPRPLGIAASVYWQKQDYDVTSAIIEIGDLRIIEVDTSGIDAKIDSQSIGIKADLWVLPFLNLYAGLGTSQTEADIFIRNAPSVFSHPLPRAAIPRSSVARGSCFSSSLGPTGFSAGPSSGATRGGSEACPSPSPGRVWMPTYPLSVPTTSTPSVRCRRSANRSRGPASGWAPPGWKRRSKPARPSMKYVSMLPSPAPTGRRPSA